MTNQNKILVSVMLLILLLNIDFLYAQQLRDANNNNGHSIELTEPYGVVNEGSNIVELREGTVLSEDSLTLPLPSACDPVNQPVIYSAPPDISKIVFPCLNWKNYVYWVSPVGKKEPYHTWDSKRKKRLKEIFDSLWKGEELKLDCPDPNYSTEFVTINQALDVYLAHAANAIYLEYNRLVPTRLHSLPESELKQILSPEAYFQPIPANWVVTTMPQGIGPGTGYVTPFREWMNGALVCDPTVGYKFMKQHNLLGGTEKDTLIRLTAFARDEISHLDGGLKREEISLLKDRLQRKLSRDGTMRGYWVGGCQGAGNFIADLARSVNIPLLRAGMFDPPYYINSNLGGSHHGLVWRWVRGGTLVLQHVDDIYAADFYNYVFPVVKDISGWRKATVQEKDSMFFDTHWVSPQTLIKYSFEYKLQPQSILGRDFVCDDPRKCDTTYTSFQIGFWKEDPKEKAERLKAQNQWQQYLASLTQKVMRDGKKCYDPPLVITSYETSLLLDIDRYQGIHPECKEEAEVNQARITESYRKWYSRDMRNFRRDNGIKLGEYQLLANYCGLSSAPPHLLIDWMQSYIDETENSNPVNHYTAHQLIDWAKTIVTVYGGCRKIQVEYKRQRDWSKRLTP